MKDDNQPLTTYGEQSTSSDMTKAMVNLFNRNEEDRKITSGILKDIETQKGDIKNTHQLVTFGYFIALLMVATMLVTIVLYAVDSFTKNNQQVLILQEIKDTLGK